MNSYKNKIANTTREITNSGPRHPGEAPKGSGILWLPALADRGGSVASVCERALAGGLKNWILLGAELGFRFDCSVRNLKAKTPMESGFLLGHTFAHPMGNVKNLTAGEIILYTKLTEHSGKVTYRTFYMICHRGTSTRSSTVVRMSSVVNPST